MENNITDEEDNIRITIRTPKRIGSKHADQQTINAYLANELAILKQKLTECQLNSTPLAIWSFPRIRVCVDESDDELDDG